MPHRPVPLAATAAAALALALPSAAAAQEPPPQPSAQRTLTVIATGNVPIERPKEQTNAAFAAAVEAARQKVAPAAIEAARGEAVRLGFAANLTVLGLLSVADVQPTPWGPFGGNQLEGTFGPGRYCGNVRTAVRRRVNGRLRSTGRVRTRRVCRVPPYATRTISATYEVAPK